MAIARKIGTEKSGAGSFNKGQKDISLNKGNGNAGEVALYEELANEFVLSERERQIMELVSEGKGSHEIAEALLITYDMVEHDLRSIIDKLRVNGNGKTEISTQPIQQTKSSQPKIVASIPCYNEERYITDLITRVREYVDQVIVVNDGSSDNTSEAATAAGALVLSHLNNKGAGAATRSCFETGKMSGADILITIDGDNQHSPEEIPDLLAPILNGEADLVIGSRFIKPDRQNTPAKWTNVPRYRKFGIDVITWLVNVFSKTKVSDSQSCFRAYSRDVLDAINITEDGFGFSIEVLIQADQKGFPIKEVPISCLYHSDGSTINPVKHGIGVALTVVKLRLKGLFSKLTDSRNA